VDRQEAALRRDLRDAGIRVSRNGDNLVLSIDEDILFPRNSALPYPRGRGILRDLASVLRDYDATYVDVDGFTDTTGSRDYNLRLSQDRAGHVADMLMQGGVAPARVTAQGFGERELRIPTADGVDEPLNRRVEITLEPYIG
jgi:outer membrane protein OmpA-like peptidoglycan-associated protein